MRNRTIDRPFWIGLFGAGFLGLLLASPWIARVWQYSHQQFRVQTVIEGATVQQLVNQDYLNYLGYLLGPPQRGYLLLALGGLGLLLALYSSGRGRSPTVCLAVWALLLIGLTLPWGLRLGPFRPDHYAILQFLPACLFTAALLGSASQALGALCLGLLCLWGGKETAAILNPTTILATPADRQALDWIRENTPPDARFFINTTGWQGSALRGVDGGAWITVYTGRPSLIPAVIYEWGSLDYARQIRDWAQRARDIKSCSADFWQLVKADNISYIYLREGTGSLQPQELEGCPGIVPVYVRNEITIYSIKE